MTKQFIKKGELSLINGGYLVNKSETPVYNLDFVGVQKSAEILCKIAQEAKNKDFVGKSPDNIEDIRAKIIKECTEEKSIKVFDSPKEPVGKLSDSLAKEALSFINFHKDTTKINYLNDSIQEFKIIHEFEEFGLFFEENICKLNKIYTIADIKEALEILYTKLH